MLKINLFEFNLSYLQMFKLTFSLFLFIVFVYINITDQDDLFTDKERKYMKSGLLSNKYLKDIFKILGGTLTLASSTITVSDHIKLKSNLEKMKTLIEDNNKELDNTKTENIQLQKEITMARKVNSVFDERLNEISENNRNSNILNTKREKLINELENCEDPAKKLKLESEISIINNQIWDYGEKTDKGLLSLEKDNSKYNDKGFDPDADKIQKAAILDFEAIWTFLESIDVFHRIAFSILMFKSIIVSSCISIVFIFYGDYLLKKYNIEERYPKLAKIIQLRRKLQRYYLLAAISTILIVSFIEIIFSITVLSL